MDINHVVEEMLAEDLESTCNYFMYFRTCIVSRHFASFDIAVVDVPSSWSGPR